MAGDNKKIIIKIPVEKIRKKVKKLLNFFSKEDLIILFAVIFGLVVLGVIFLFVEIIAKITRL